MKIKDCMKHNVVSISAAATIGQAAKRIVTRRIGSLPVVDSSGRLVGMLRLRDLLSLVMPDFVRLVEDIDFVHDFGALENRQPDIAALARPLREVMQSPVSVEETCGLLRAVSLMRLHDLQDLPVVDSAGRLTGIASRVDIGVALLSGWQSTRVEDET
jgi:CBS-domain-containing membrane protein